MSSFACGLDIASRSAEVIALSKKGGRIRVEKYGALDIPVGLISRGVIQDADKLGRVLSGFLNNVFGPKRGTLMMGVSLPESLTYSKIFTLPANLPLDMAIRAAENEAASFLPMALSDVVVSPVVISRTKEKQDLLYAVADKVQLEAYLNVLRQAEVAPAFVDSASLALARAIVDPNEAEPVLIADLGAQITILAVFDRGAIRLSSDVNIGGETLTAAVQSQLNVPPDQAETLKRQSGLDRAVGDGKVFAALQKPVGDLVSEMARTINFYGQKHSRAIRKVIMTGGATLTPHIIDYVAYNLAGVKVIQGLPLKDMDLAGLPQPKELEKSSLIYANAVGLAFRAGGFRTGLGIDLSPGRRPTSNAASASWFGSLFQSKPSAAPAAPVAPAEVKKPEAAPAAPSAPAWPAKPFDVSPAAPQPSAAAPAAMPPVAAGTKTAAELLASLTRPSAPVPLPPPAAPPIVPVAPAVPPPVPKKFAWPAPAARPAAVPPAGAPKPGKKAAVPAAPPVPQVPPVAPKLVWPPTVKPPEPPAAPPAYVPPPPAPWPPQPPQPQQPPQAPPGYPPPWPQQPHWPPQAPQYPQMPAQPTQWPPQYPPPPPPPYTPPSQMPPYMPFWPWGWPWGWPQQPPQAPPGYPPSAPPWPPQYPPGAPQAPWPSPQQPYPPGTTPPQYPQPVAPEQVPLAPARPPAPKPAAPPAVPPAARPAVLPPTPPARPAAPPLPKTAAAPSLPAEVPAAKPAVPPAAPPAAVKPQAAPAKPAVVPAVAKPPAPKPAAPPVVPPAKPPALPFHVPVVKPKTLGFFGAIGETLRTLIAPSAKPAALPPKEPLRPAVLGAPKAETKAEARPPVAPAKPSEKEALKPSAKPEAAKSAPAPAKEPPKPPAKPAAPTVKPAGLFGSLKKTFQSLIKEGPAAPAAPAKPAVPPSARPPEKETLKPSAKPEAAKPEAAKEPAKPSVLPAAQKEIPRPSIPAPAPKPSATTREALATLLGDVSKPAVAPKETPKAPSKGVPALPAKIEAAKLVPPPAKEAAKPAVSAAEKMGGLFHTLRRSFQALVEQKHISELKSPAKEAAKPAALPSAKTPAKPVAPPAKPASAPVKEPPKPPAPPARPGLLPASPAKPVASPAKPPVVVKPAVILAKKSGGLFDSLRQAFGSLMKKASAKPPALALKPPAFKPAVPPPAKPGPAAPTKVAPKEPPKEPPKPPPKPPAPPLPPPPPPPPPPKPFSEKDLPWKEPYKSPPPPGKEFDTHAPGQAADGKPAAPPPPPKPPAMSEPVEPVTPAKKPGGMFQGLARLFSPAKGHGDDDLEQEVLRDLPPILKEIMKEPYRSTVGKPSAPAKSPAKPPVQPPAAPPKGPFKPIAIPALFKAPASQPAAPIQPKPPTLPVAAPAASPAKPPVQPPAAPAPKPGPVRPAWPPPSLLRSPAMPAPEPETGLLVSLGSLGKKLGSFIKAKPAAPGARPAPLAVQSVAQVSHKPVAVVPARTAAPPLPSQINESSNTSSPIPMKGSAKGKTQKGKAAKGHVPPPEAEEAPVVVSGAAANPLLDSSRYNIPEPASQPPPEEAVPAEAEAPAEEYAAPAEAAVEEVPAEEAVAEEAPAEEYAAPVEAEAAPEEAPAEEAEAAGAESILPPELAAAPAARQPAAARGSKTLWVDSIVAGRRPEDAEAPAETETSPRPKARLLPWVLLVLVVIIVAAGGVYMFGKKAGLDYANVMGSTGQTVSDRVGQLWISVSGLLSRKASAPAPAPGDELNVNEEAVAPAIPGLADTQVSLVVLLGREKKPGGTAVSLQTRVIETDVTATQTFPSTGKGPAPDTGGIATGKLTLINKTAQPMTLIVKTRCLSKEGVLFRLKSQANIPAKGSVEAEVYADQPGASGDIGPTTFTIPGLSAESQKVIYAESAGRMSGGAGAETVKVVTLDDVTKAKSVLADRLKAEALDNLKAMAAKTELVLPDLVTSQELSAKAPAAGAVSPDFSLKVSLRFRALLVPEDEIDALLNEMLKQKLTEGASLADYGLGQAQYTVEAYDTATDLAEIRVEASIQKQ